MVDYTPPRVQCSRHQRQTCILCLCHHFPTAFPQMTQFVQKMQLPSTIGCDGKTAAFWSTISLKKICVLFIFGGIVIFVHPHKRRIGFKSSELLQGASLFSNAFVVTFQANGIGRTIIIQNFARAGTTGNSKTIISSYIRLKLRGCKRDRLPFTSSDIEGGCVCS